MIGVLDADGMVTAADDAFVELLGPDGNQLVGTLLADRMSVDQARQLAELLTDATPSAAPMDWSGVRIDGLPWAASLALWRTPERGGTTGAGPIIVSGRRRFGPVRWTADPEPEPPTGLASTGIDGVIAHDIRGALRGGSGFVSVVARTLVEPSIARLDERLSRASEHLEIASRSLATADELTEKVVRYLRWPERVLAVEPRPLAELVADATARSRDSFDGDPAEVHLDDSLPAVLVDSEPIEWALAELITNARKFHRLPGADAESGATTTVVIEPAGATELATRGTDDPLSDGRFVVVAVRDDGIGIDPALVRDAMLPGRKLQPRGDYPGVGMGLALCELVFARHAGWCRIVAPPPLDGRPAARRGTTVVFRLPVSPPERFIAWRGPR